MTLYKAYQKVGGTDEWIMCHDTTDLAAIAPAFITVLSCDTLLAKDSPKAMVDSCKYLGPLYFDLDSTDIEESIEGAKALVVKLKKYDLEDSDIEIFLSGKKGLHILVPPTVFMEKVLPVNKLPAIYKEIAFKLAVPTLDFAVYSARKGRMLRTTYVQRENGNFKVQITAAELAELTPEKYEELCKAPRALIKTTPVFRPQLAILYAGVEQKLRALKKIRTKKVDAATLRRHLPIIKQLMKGESVKEGVGFNKIAIQLGIYAHEAKLSEDELIAQCQGLIENHTGDGYRYNSAGKREHELRRMYCYLDENCSGYDYAIGPIQAMLESRDEFGEDDDQEEYTTEDTSGIFIKNNNYYAATEQGDRHIMDACFKNVSALLDPETEAIAVIKATIVTGNRSSAIKLERDAFASNSALHRAISDRGVSFTGNDTHARYIYSHMLKEIKLGTATSYATTSEGLDVLCMPQSNVVEARKPFLVWADANEVRIPKHLYDLGLRVELAPDPGPAPLLKTDLANAPSWPKFVALDPGNVERMQAMLEGLLGCQEAPSLAKIIGWTTASFYTQLFRLEHNQFPLLHVAGPAGTGKSRMLESMMHMFYLNQKPVITTASSSNFAITSIMSGSASIPVIIDEYKPHTMSQQKLEDMRSYFRSSYNGHAVSRGGGNRATPSFKGLSQVDLTGPTAFLAEAMETEGAILHRTVLVTLKRQSGRLSGRTKPSWDKFQANVKCLAIIGQHLAASIVSQTTIESFNAEFQPILDRVTKALSIQPEDSLETCDANTLFIKQNMNERSIFNYAVTEYGLIKFAEVVALFLPKAEDSLAERVLGLIPYIYTEMDKIVKNSVPEFIKVFEMLSDMSRFAADHPCKLTNHVDFEVKDMGGKAVLNIIGRLAYNKYRLHCRNINVLPLFMGDASFVQAMKDSPLYIMGETGTTQVRQESLLLDYDAMQRNGVYAFQLK